MHVPNPAARMISMVSLGGIGRCRRFGGLLMVMLAVWAITGGLLLPYDSAPLLALRWNLHRLRDWLHPPYDNEDWLFAAPAQMVDLDRDVAYIVKTGFGTQDRVPALLDAMRAADGGRAFMDNTLVVADFATTLKLDDDTMGEITVIDAVAESIRRIPHVALSDSPRLVKYDRLKAAIASGDKTLAREVGSKVGWELDAMKFIPGLEMLYHRHPDKKWYIMLDDDTYMIKPSMAQLLSHLDPTRAYYVGNAVGDYKGRFAHGGSALALSQAAVQRLVVTERRLLPDAYAAALTETWGDRLVALALLRVGVYLDERFRHYFNGEAPAVTRLRPDRFCSPLVSFHKLGDPDEMRAVGDRFRAAEGLVRWNALWELYGLQNLTAARGLEAVERNADHVGRADPDEQVVTAEGVASADKCMGICKKRAADCMAWTYEEATRRCHYAPWAIMGDRPEGEQGVVSGLNIDRVTKLAKECHRRGFR